MTRRTSPRNTIDTVVVVCCIIALLVLLYLARPAAAAAAGAQDASLPERVTIVYLGRAYDDPEPLSLIDKVATDQGIQGARIAIDENERTGRLLGKTYTLQEVVAKPGDDLLARAREVMTAGHRLIVLDLEAADQLAVADLPEARDAILLDIRASDDELRQAGCRANVFHLRPSYAMKADALSQYLAWKKWRRWLLVSGRKPKDLAFAAAVRRAAQRFGNKIVEERSYTFEAGSRRTDTGHQQIQTQMPQLTQGAPEHDVVIVADEEETFGDYVLFRTSEPRPVAGTHGLVPTAWHRSFEEYAATQMQNRFERRNSRALTERDYTGWLAVRIFGEVVARAGSLEPAAVRDYLRSDKFEVAGFKGIGLTFRRWDQQLRQPILLAGPRALVSISPQDGFLHPKHLTDTLGIDEPETQCRLSPR